MQYIITNMTKSLINYAFGNRKSFEYASKIIDGKIYFTKTNNNTTNLHSLDTIHSRIEQVTNHKHGTLNVHFIGNNKIFYVEIELNNQTNICMFPTNIIAQFMLMNIVHIPITY